jgi:hypothetical protein
VWAKHISGFEHNSASPSVADLLHLDIFSELLQVWDAPRTEFWPTLIWDRHSRQISAQMDVEVLAKLPAILREAEGKPEYQKLWWAGRTLADLGRLGQVAQAK